MLSAEKKTQLEVLFCRRMRIKQRMLVKMNWQEECILKHELIDVNFLISTLQTK
jgi:hypothetical protein